MQDVKEKIRDLAKKFEVYFVNFKLEEKEIKLRELEAKTSDPSLWDDQNNAKKLLQEFSDLKSEIEEVKKLQEDIKTLEELGSQEDLTDELAKEVAKAEKSFEKLNLESFLSGDYDAKDAIVAIHAGQGGTEAMDWASMLFRMYSRFCERRDWTLSVLDSTAGEEAGIKSITFKVEGKHTYGYLKGEAGTHRLVRQSPFNADKLRQTSFALVEVLPEFEDVDLPDIKIEDEDLDWQFFRSSSQGGQNVQKVSTAVRLIHKPTGITVTAQSERFQEQNRKNALNLLRSKLWLASKERAKETKKEIKGEYRPASWGTQIRSYVLHPIRWSKI